MSPFKCTCEPLRACGNFSGGVKMRGVRKDSKACVSVGLAAVSNNMPLLPKQQVPGRLHLRKKGVLLEGIKRHRFMSEGNVRKEMEQSYNSSSSKVPRTGLERLHPTAPRERRGSDSIGSACTGRSGPCGQQGLRGDSKDRRDRFLVECGVILDMKVLASFGNPGVPNPDYSSLMIALDPVRGPAKCSETTANPSNPSSEGSFFRGLGKGGPGFACHGVTIKLVFTSFKCPQRGKTARAACPSSQLHESSEMRLRI